MAFNTSSYIYEGHCNYFTYICILADVVYTDNYFAYTSLEYHCCKYPNVVRRPLPIFSIPSLAKFTHINSFHRNPI